MKISREEIYGIKPFNLPTVVTRAPIVDSFMTKKIGHTFTKLNYPYPGNKRYMVQDFIFEETQTTGAVNVFDKTKRFSLNTSNEFALSFFADMDKKFVIKMPKDITRAFFSIFVGRELTNRQLAQPGFYDSLSANIQFDRLNGNTPLITYNHFAIQNGYNGAIMFNVEGEFFSDFSFDNIELTGIYPSRIMLPSSEDYSLFSYAAPFGIHSANSVAYAMFGYATNEKQDPGPFIGLKKP